MCRRTWAALLLFPCVLCARLSSVSGFYGAPCSWLNRWHRYGALSSHRRGRESTRLFYGDGATSAAERRLLIHWRGEGVEGYSMQFRHLELYGSLQAVLDPGRFQHVLATGTHFGSIRFENALNYTGSELTSDVKVTGYNQAMQYWSVPIEIPVSACIQAAERCSLIHSLFEIVAEANSNQGYGALSDVAIKNEAFRDMWKDFDGPSSTQSWCVRVRHYGSNDNAAKERRYGARARSLSMEREALQALSPILRKLGGKVDLNQPDCKIYVFDGLRSPCSGEEDSAGEHGSLSALARRLAQGARTSTINPNTRLCVTNTPLCPVAAFIMCNTAQIRPYSTVLDPFCGSAATLLAAAMLSPTCSTVGIEIAHDGIVSRDDIRRDFSTRGLTEPIELLLGDSSSPEIRAQARLAVCGRPFDCIVTDPPYGIRESTGVLERRPIEELLRMIAEDRDAGTPLLRNGGRLVVFLPQQTEVETLIDILPTEEQIQAAGLRLDVMREQPLNDVLSRWLVSFVCV